MQIQNSASMIRLAPLALLAIGAVSCGLDKQSAPPLTGPSEFATSVTLIASPDIVNRDGESQSTIVITARDASGAPLPNQTLRLGLNPSNGGALSTGQVTTNGSGEARAVFTAPPMDTAVDVVEITATPVGTNFDNAATRIVAVALAAPDAAVPSFAVNPASPRRFELTTFDASGTTVDGVACGPECRYEWDFGGEASATGQVVTHRFSSQQTYIVTLNVTSPGGVRTKRQQNVVVQSAVAPTLSFSVSPTAPLVNQTVFLNASASTAAQGATIVEYAWDFGNGSTGSGMSPTTSYGVKGTYVVRLTVRDSNGVTATITQNVTVADPS